MIRKFLLLLAMLVVTTGLAFAQVDASKADQASLDGIKGVGPKMSKTILAERKRGGEFKDWGDFEKRVKGIKEKSARKLSENGLTVNGQSRRGSPPKPGKQAKDKEKNTRLQMVSGKEDVKASPSAKARMSTPSASKAAGSMDNTK